MSQTIQGPIKNKIEEWQWKTTTVVERRSGDVDRYRRDYGKAEGERRFFAEHEIEESVCERGNLLMYLGASCVWGCLSGLGSATSGQALTYFNNANTNVWVGDGGYTSGALSGTVSVTNGSTTATFSTSQTGLIGNYLVVLGDSTYAAYPVVSGSGTSWVLGKAFGGTTAGTATCYKIVGELPNQTGLAATTNVANQVADSGYPTYADGNSPLAVTAATNATPIVITTATHSWSTGDFVHIQGVLGNAGANGPWQITVLSSTTFSLNNSVGSGSYTSGGLASKNNVFVTQATFAPSAAVFPWYEWGIRNSASSGTGRPLNRKVVFLGVKANTASWTFRNAISLA